MNKISLKLNQTYTRSFFALVITLMIVSPFQGLITMWPASVFGHQLFWQVIKEIFLIVSLGLLLYMLIRNQELRRVFLKNKLFWIIAAYITLHIILVLFKPLNLQASASGLIFNLRFIFFFVVTYATGYIFEKKSENVAFTSMMAVATIVVIFGILQMTVLPKSVLSHFGYNGKPIPATFYIDGDINSVRIASTTRGPNNLGAYLIIPITVSLAYISNKIFKKLNLNQKNIIFIYITALCGIVVLFGTHSRSAFVGLAISLLTWAIINFGSFGKKILIIITLISIFIGGITAYMIRDTYLFHAVVLHDVEGSGDSLTSNRAHFVALQKGFRDVVDSKLLGCGPGCAGPASIRSPRGAHIAENYYIQIAQEVGVLGIGLFMTIVVMVGYQLFKYRALPLGSILLATLVGISVVNLFLHAWTDDTIAYVWWGLAGLFIGSYNRLDLPSANSKSPHTSV